MFIANVIETPGSWDPETRRIDPVYTHGLSYDKTMGLDKKVARVVGLAAIISGTDRIVDLTLAIRDGSDRRVRTKLSKEDSNGIIREARIRSHCEIEGEQFWAYFKEGKLKGLEYPCSEFNGLIGGI